MQAFRVCCFWRRIFKARAVEPPEDIKRVFELYSENGTMNANHLQRFLIEVQREYNTTEQDVQEIFNSLKHLNIFQRKGLHLEAFFRYLLGERNHALSPSLEVHHDMTAPLAHYYLYTSHNTYLTGNQLSSACSVDPIIKALKKGVKVIELDLWPNQTNDDVDVKHGGTITPPVRLIKCLQAIRNHAFHASEYPVIITFEDHLTPNLQLKVARMVTETFGDMLFRPESDLKNLPSPESLKKRILISTKPPKESHEVESTIVKGNPQKLKASTEEEPRDNKNRAVDNEIKTDGKGHGELDDRLEDHQDEDLQNAAPEYRHLIAIPAGKPKGTVRDALSIDLSKVRRLSLSEQKLENAVATHGNHIVRFTQRNLLRIYPKGTRLDSSNYNPLVGWMHGAQMVAFNMQGHGKYLWEMEGMFRANGGCGYVKKPDFLLKVGPNGEVFDPKETLPIKTTLKVKVYMGEGWHSRFRPSHFDRYSPPDFFTRIGIAGVPADNTHMMLTKTIPDEWLPLWDEEFEFPLTVPELALLRIDVMDYDTSGDHDFAGQTCLPVSELKSGIRSVSLYSKDGNIYKSVRLLMSFKFVVYNSP